MLLRTLSSLSARIRRGAPLVRHPSSVSSASSSEPAPGLFDSILKIRSQDTPLYPGHIPTTSSQKKLLAVVSLVAATIDPSPAKVTMVGEVTGHNALRKMHERMLADLVGRRILREKPRIRSDTIDFNYLRSLPEHTFGYAYAKFMDSNGFEPEGHPLVTHVDDVDLAYVMLWYHELHDFWHVHFDVPTTLLGETIVKYVEEVQMELPMNTAITYFGWLKVSPLEVLLGKIYYVSWAKRAGRNASFLMSAAVEEEFETPLEELRT